MADLPFFELAVLDDFVAPLTAATIDCLLDFGLFVEVFGVDPAFADLTRLALRKSVLVGCRLLESSGFVDGAWDVGDAGGPSRLSSVITRSEAAVGNRVGARLGTLLGLRVGFGVGPMLGRKETVGCVVGL